MSTPEGAVLSAILEYLEIRHVFAWRNNTGAVKVEARPGQRFIRFGKRGSSDILGVLDDGRALAIEVKGPKGKATFEQLDFLAEIAKRGGVAFIARSIEDVDRHLFQPGYGRESVRGIQG
ncbi:MAG: VRR-NUC domain-containing protein [Elusimicrobia bacterium]|nr:VRR-NUC domain-containing protein [Elusimicrobiota bacterium]